MPIDKPTTMFTEGMVRGMALRAGPNQPVLTGFEAVAVHALLEALALVTIMPSDSLDRVADVVRCIGVANATTSAEATLLAAYSHLCLREIDERKRRAAGKP
jgi:hypothetical protein